MIVPTSGLKDHVTPVWDAPVEAVNVVLCPAVNVALAGDNFRSTAASRTVAVAVFVGSATLVAVMVMVSGLAIVAGA